MVTKPDFSKERKEYQEVEAILRRRALLSLLAMALQSSLVANFNLSAFLKIFFIIMYIVQGLVLGMCVFLSWYQKYKLKRLTQGRELWYFWARVGEGIKYFFIARTRKTRAERRAHDKTYKVSVESAAKMDRNAAASPAYGANLFHMPLRGVAFFISTLNLSKYPSGVSKGIFLRFREFNMSLSVLFIALYDTL